MQKIGKTKEKRAIIIHRFAKPKILATFLAAGADLRQPAVMDAARRDFHRTYYGWWRGLEKLGWHALLLDRPSYLIPLWLCLFRPSLFVRLLQWQAYRRSPQASAARVLDRLIFQIHLLAILWSDRPKFVIFPYDALSRPLRAFCRRAGIRTIGFFGVLPSLKSTRVRARVAEYDAVLSGYNLPALWPEIEGRFYRLILGPSQESDFFAVEPSPRNIDVCVIGRFDTKLFRTRSTIVELLLQAAEPVGIGVYVHGYTAGDGLGEEYSFLKRALRGGLYGPEYYRTLARSKIVLTIPSDEHLRIGSARPQGIMEGAASGAVQIAYDTPEARDLFIAGTEIVLFRNNAELLSLVQHYLAHPDECEAIARRARQKVLRAYTSEKQIAGLVEWMGFEEPAKRRDGSEDIRQ